MALLLTHCLALSWAGGFHYDEAWAALFSHRIATEPGFWPVAAMSPYTSAWGHYVTAFFYKLLGTSLFTYRLSGIALVVAGISLISLALKNMGQVRAAALFPSIIAFFSAAVMNHRFAIEINTFHVFCLGLLAWGLSEKTPSWKSEFAIFAAIVFGVTSHVLFLAPAFALLLLSFWYESFLPKNDQGNRKRRIAGAALVLLAGFFLRIHLGIPEKDKSFALLLLAILSLMGVLFPQLSSQLIQRIRRYFEIPVRILFLCAGSVALFFLLFFSEGSWAAAFFNGGQSDPRLMIWPLLALGIGIASSWRTLRALFDQDLHWTKAFLWAALTLILTTAMATKPAPRYFEIPFLMLAAVFALALAHAPKRIASLAILIWIFAGTCQLQRNYLGPVVFGNIPERSFRFLVFKDNSSDTLSKQKLAQYLVRSGCKFEQIRSSDVRILEPLKFLSLGDWRPETTDVSRTCRLGSEVQVERTSQVSLRPAHAVEYGPFILYSNAHP
ncbi:MAG: hypothetical protein ACJ763_01090 [Bdellovibrionia bacterium]